MMDSREPWDNNGSEDDRWWEDYCKGEDALLAMLGINLYAED